MKKRMTKKCDSRISKISEVYMKYYGSENVRIILEDADYLMNDADQKNDKFHCYFKIIINIPRLDTNFEKYTKSFIINKVGKVVFADKKDVNRLRLLTKWVKAGGVYRYI